MTRASPARAAAKKAGARPRRGDPGETRARLVNAAAREIEAHGYFGTDSNRIAKLAGYSPGVFYKHFEDKRAILLAAYEEWVTREWSELQAILDRGGSRATLTEALADAVIDHHRRWPGMRASVRALVVLDPVVRRAHRAWRRKQLQTLDAVSGASVSQRAILLWVAERIGDAFADGELHDLAVDEREVRAFLVARIEETLGEGSAALDRRRA